MRDTIVVGDTPKFLNREDETPQLSFGNQILISNGQLSPYITVKIGGCEFDLVTQLNDTVYLATNDEKFLTPEGYKIGTKLSDLPQEFQNKLTKEPGWGYHFKLGSGWTLGFCEGESCTANYPAANSQVKWIFKRR